MPPGAAPRPGPCSPTRRACPRRGRGRGPRRAHRGPPWPCPPRPRGPASPGTSPQQPGRPPCSPRRPGTLQRSPALPRRDCVLGPLICGHEQVQLVPEPGHGARVLGRGQRSPELLHEALLPPLPLLGHPLLGLALEPLLHLLHCLLLELRQHLVRLRGVDVVLHRPADRHLELPHVPGGGRLLELRRDLGLDGEALEEGAGLGHAPPHFHVRRPLGRGHLCAPYRVSELCPLGARDGQVQVRQDPGLRVQVGDDGPGLPHHGAGIAQLLRLHGLAQGLPERRHLPDLLRPAHLHQEALAGLHQAPQDAMEQRQAQDPAVRPASSADNVHAVAARGQRRRPLGVRLHPAEQLLGIGEGARPGRGKEGLGLLCKGPGTLVGLPPRALLGLEAFEQLIRGANLDVCPDALGDGGLESGDVVRSHGGLHVLHHGTRLGLPRQVPCGLLRDQSHRGLGVEHLLPQGAHPLHGDLHLGCLALVAAGEFQSGFELDHRFSLPSQRRLELLRIHDERA
mmetsp:Transcript_10891/g.31219  ORF Transcript_10891/g.31219 Transcript_10891/m.31219 type:complete len:511 (+) Transcript_10891:2355-3887(+)